MNVGNIAHTSLEQMAQPGHQPHIGMQLRSDTSQNGAAQPLRELLHAPLLHSASQPLPQEAGEIKYQPGYCACIQLPSDMSRFSRHQMTAQDVYHTWQATCHSYVHTVLCTQCCKLLLSHLCNQQQVCTATHNCLQDMITAALPHRVFKAPLCVAIPATASMH